MKSVLIALPLLALAHALPGAPESGAPMPAGTAAPEPIPTDKPEGPHISITSYDSPWSSGDSTWTVKTAVSYETASNYTSMMTGKPTSASAAVLITASVSPSGHSSAASAATSGSQSAEPYHGAANKVAGGAGALLFAGLAYFL